MNDNRLYVYENFKHFVLLNNKSRGKLICQEKKI